MKLHAITAIILAFGTPADAGADDLARSLGVEPGKYTAHQLARLKSLESASPGESRAYFGNDESRDGVVNPTAEARFNQLAAEENNGAKARFTRPEVSRGGMNPVAQAKFKALAAED